MDNCAAATVLVRGAVFLLGGVFVFVFVFVFRFVFVFLPVDDPFLWEERRSCLVPPLPVLCLARFVSAVVSMLLLLMVLLLMVLLL